MTPSSLRAWLAERSEPISIKEIESLRYQKTGKFSERQIRKSMKSLEMAELVGFVVGEQNTKLWYVLGSKADPKTAEPAPTA